MMFQIDLSLIVVIMISLSVFTSVNPVLKLLLNIVFSYIATSHHENMFSSNLHNIFLVFPVIILLFLLDRHQECVSR